MRLFFAAIFAFFVMPSGIAIAQTIEFDARSDFENLDGGDAPYYLDNRREALAIDAEIPEYRNVFARASTSFEGSGGTYDVTITALGETDGECEYQFLVNGQVVGSAVNAPTDDDYEVQLHTFTGISIPQGAEIAVESNALTNGQIPEGDGTAFARGRWQTLTLQQVAEAPATVDLAMSMTFANQTAIVGEDYTATLTVTNNSDNDTATNPVITLPLPADTSLSDSGSCVVADGNASCALEEIAPGASTDIEISANTTTEGSVTFAPSVSADQTDSDAANNATTAQIQINAQSPATVDLALSVTSDIDVVNAGQTVSFQITVTNNHQETTATSPVTGAALPAGLEFASSSDCTSNEQVISCFLPELAPNQSATATFSVTALRPGNAALLASVSANEPENTVTDNEVTHTITVTDSPSSEPAANQTAMTDSGGSFGLPLLLMLLLTCGVRLRKPLP